MDEAKEMKLKAGGGFLLTRGVHFLTSTSPHQSTFSAAPLCTYNHSTYPRLIQSKVLKCSSEADKHDPG